MEVEKIKMWVDIDSAPKDRRILLFGHLQPFEGLRVRGSEIFTGYWDDIDGAWCGSGSTWIGPFYVPTHWQELPNPPK